MSDVILFDQLFGELGFQHLVSRTRKVPIGAPDWDNRSGLVLWLEGNNSDSTWLDRSLYGNNGTVYGATTPPAATVSGNGYLFDGVDDYTDHGNPVSLRLTDKVSIEAWVNATSLVAAYSNLVSKSADYMLYFTTNKISFQVITTGGTTAGYLNIVNSPATWYHFAAVYNGSGYKIYRNGIAGTILWNSGPYTGAMVATAAVLAIGRVNPVSGRYYAGIVDTVRVYNRERSDGEILEYYNRTKTRYGL